MSHATPPTLTAHYASSLNALLLITACVALTAGALSLALIRQRDFEPQHQSDATGEALESREGADPASDGTAAQPAGLVTN